MSFEDAIRKIIQEENKKHLSDIKNLLETHGYNEAPRMLSPRDAAKILNVGVNKIYEICNKSEHNGFPVIREGKGNKFLIPYTALMNWIDQQSKHAM